MKYNDKMTKNCKLKRQNDKSAVLTSRDEFITSFHKNETIILRT